MYTSGGAMVNKLDEQTISGEFNFDYKTYISDFVL